MTEGKTRLRECVIGWYNRSREGEKEIQVDNEDGVNWNGCIWEENEIRQEKFKWEWERERERERRNVEHLDFKWGQQPWPSTATAT